MVNGAENEVLALYCPIRRRFASFSKRSNRALDHNKTLGYLLRCKETRINPNTPIALCLTVR
jgi:hypothetical protein